MEASAPQKYFSKRLRCAALRYSALRSIALHCDEPVAYSKGSPLTCFPTAAILNRASMPAFKPARSGIGKSDSVMSATIHPEIHRPISSPDLRRLSDDYLDGVEAIATFMGWTARKVRYARETGALPIRAKHGIGLYAFKSELIAALKTPATLSSRLANGTG